MIKLYLIPEIIKVVKEQAESLGMEIQEGDDTEISFEVTKVRNIELIHVKLSKLYSSPYKLEFTVVETENGLIKI